MTVLLNRDLFVEDPAQHPLRNDGVAKLDSRDTLAEELRMFVCSGQYERGLEQILTTFLSRLSSDLSEQSAAWVSGFYGSGKSHLVKILEALWRNELIEGIGEPRSIARLTDPVKDLLHHLSTEGQRGGGLWSASGMLTGSSSGNADISVRMLILSIVYRAAGYSSIYSRAKFVIWAQQQPWYDEVVNDLAERGLDAASHFEKWALSPEVAKAVLRAQGLESSDPIQQQTLWKSDFNKTDISMEEFESDLREVLLLHSRDGKTLPLTLIVLDEAQQYIGENANRSQLFQEVAECLASKFEGAILLVATGQAALNTTANLTKLQGRFTVQVMLRDADIDEVVRSVVLKKNAVNRPAVEQFVTKVEGEIDRHLQHSRIAPTAADRDVLAADYPLLPTRRRFWTSLHHKLDPSGTTGTLRTQLKMVHRATATVSEKPLGHIIPADFVYDQLQSTLQSSGRLPREVANLVNTLAGDANDGPLKSRLVQTIFLISQAAGEPGDTNDPGVKATAENIADLLVENLLESSLPFRQRVEAGLQDLAASGDILRASDGSYAIQTTEGMKWNDTFNKERSAAEAGSQLGDIRRQAIEAIVRAKLTAKDVKQTQGESSQPRSLRAVFGETRPRIEPGETQVIVWVRDGWDASERAVIADARADDDDSPTLFVFVPERAGQDLKTAIIEYQAARSTAEVLAGREATAEGRQAADAMKARRDAAERRFHAILDEAVSSALVFQGGGAPVTDGATFVDKIKSAFQSSVTRLFPRFGDADSRGWEKVFTDALKGAGDALKAVGWDGETKDNPVVREVLKALPSTPTKSWTAIRKTFTSAPYGWPPEATDGALAAALQAGLIEAKRDNKVIALKDFTRQQANAIYPTGGGITVTQSQLIAVRGLFTAYDPDRSVDDTIVRNESANLVERLIQLARSTGGEPPAPLAMAPATLLELQNQAGNQLIVSLAAQRSTLVEDIPRWRATAEKLKKRGNAWELTLRLADHARQLPGAAAAIAELDAIRDGRLLLHDPDPLETPAQTIEQLLRQELTARVERYNDLVASGVAQLRESDDWSKLDEIERTSFLKSDRLQEALPPLMRTPREIADALSHQSLAQWDNLIDAAPGRIEGMKWAVARKVEGEVRDVSIERPTFRTSDDVERWIEQTRSALLAQLESGHPVRIK